MAAKPIFGQGRGRGNLGKGVVLVTWRTRPAAQKTSAQCKPPWNIPAKMPSTGNFARLRICFTCRFGGLRPRANVARSLGRAFELRRERVGSAAVASVAEGGGGGDGAYGGADG